MDKNENQKLFEDLKKGSEKAFEKVYLDNRDKFFNFSMQYGISNKDVSDIYQDVFVTFCENIQSGKLKELTCSISTYIISIGKNKIFEFLRRKKRFFDNDSSLKNLSDKDDILEPFDLEIVELSSDEEKLKACFKLLGPKCRMILTFFYFNGYKIKEIMNKGKYNSENVVKSQKSRCLKKLRELFNNG